MKQLLRGMIIFVLGIVVAAGALIIYTTLTTTKGDIRPIEAVNLTGEEQAFITALTGEVFIMRDDKITAANLGDPLYKGDIIKVVDDSFCQIQFSQTAAARIRSNSLIRISELFKLGGGGNVKTEVLTGSMLYRVNKLKEGEKLEVKSEDQIFSVRGTLFLVSRDSSGNTLIVDEGQVAVLSQGGIEEELINHGFTFSSPLGQESQKTETNDRDKKIFTDEGKPQLINPAKNQPVQTALITIPSDAQIYVNGYLSGRGAFKGLFEEEEEVHFLIRKRGYSDKILTIKAVSNLEYTVRLDPEGNDKEAVENERIRSDAEKTVADSRLIINSLKEEIRSKSEKLKNLEILITTLKGEKAGFQSKVATLERESAKLRNEISNLEINRRSLEGRITEFKSMVEASNEREEKLKSLIKQIQDISNSE